MDEKTAYLFSVCPNTLFIHIYTATLAVSVVELAGLVGDVGMEIKLNLSGKWVRRCRVDLGSTIPFTVLVIAGHCELCIDGVGWAAESRSIFDGAYYCVKYRGK